MPRTAKTTAIKHDGSEVLLAGKTVSLLEQKELVKKIRSTHGGERIHDEYAEISYQESDGHEQVFKFLSPKDHAANEKAIADFNKKAEEQRKKDAARIAAEKSGKKPAADLPKPEEK